VVKKFTKTSDGLSRIVARPRLKSTTMLAAWPGVGNVATIIAHYMKEHLPFKPLASLDAAHFFDPIGVLVRNDIVESPQFPESRLYYWKNPGDKGDIILFIGDDQPSRGSYDMANAIIDIGHRFHVEKIITFAAALTKIHHTESPRVWGVATNPEMTAELTPYHILRRGNLQIAGLNGLLLGVAKEREVNGICLLGEVPNYTRNVQNPMAALSILQLLQRLLGLQLDLSELRENARETHEQMKEMASKAMEEYIDYFTTPIWQSDEDIGIDDEDEEDEDEDEAEDTSGRN
jgi:uncharacterized protein